MKYNNYTVVSPDKITEIKNDIVTRYDLTFLSYPEFGSIEEDEKQVELFAQEQENPPIYTGEMVDVKIKLGKYHWMCYDYMDFHIQLMKNYVKNVGGTIRKIKTKEFRNSTSQTFYITIAKDAPYCSNLQETFDAFAQQEHRLITRHYLRHLENKNLPEKRNERRYLGYLGIYLREKPTEIELSFFTVAIAALMIGILLEFMGVITI